MQSRARWTVLAAAVVCLTGTRRAQPVDSERLRYNEVYTGSAPPALVETVESAALQPAAGADRHLLLVSTLDGQLSALDPADGGALLWSVQAQEAGMLSSTLTQNLQLSQQGQWVRLIPSLDGRLFTFDGEQVEPLPVTAESLLQASYRFADDTVIMGGSQVATLGIDLRTGQLRYRCGPHGCARPGPTQPDAQQDVLVLRQHTQTVRAVEPRSGEERWNFSVSRHELALSAGAPAAAAAQPVFAGPLVHVWRLDGARLHEIDLVAPAAGGGGDDRSAVRPLLYLGVHQKQLYIQQSLRAPAGGSQLAVSPALRNPPLVKWRPYMVSASSRTPVIHGTTSQRLDALLLADGGATALAVRPEEYPYEGGYYLYSSDCLLEPDSHGPFPNPQLPPGDEDRLVDDGVVYVLMTSLSYWWPQILLLSASIAVLLNLLVTEHYRLYYQARAYHAVRTILRLRTPRYVVREVPVPVREEVIREVEVVREVMRDPPPAEQPPPRSRFLEDFEPVQCLGRGGFGVVFEAKNRLDGHNYAVKRIRLPGRERARRRVLREVACLAKLEHRNIVRYFYCWTERPSPDCLAEQDRVLESSEWVSSRTPLNSLESGERAARSASADSSGTFSVQDGGELGLPGSGDGTPPHHALAEDSLLSGCSEDGPWLERSVREGGLRRDAPGDEDDSVVFANDSGRPVIDYTIPDEDDDESSSAAASRSGPVVAFQTNRSPRANASDFWEEDEGEETSDDGSAVYLFIQMQLCQKESLKDWLSANCGPRNTPHVFAIFRQILNGVEYVHSQQLMHRDLKPSNIFFSLDGTIKIGDFGLATTLGGEAAGHTPAPASGVGTLHTDQVGTQLYMSPEQVLGHPYDDKVDIYSLGIILFELLVPFATQMERQQTLTLVRRLVFPEPFQQSQPDEHDLLAQMLCHQPARRPSIAEIRRSVARCDKLGSPVQESGVAVLA
ncbi:eukaryotic translation initiation factor 2-alpha kinase 3-like [Pollicipes pollicipes]|uniref:eukaryotic translation initiation factor 2-alpha kinase 3-like n=1 Tax=Pollicipes pollicipes TaxID=41117 RepID=UPI001884C8C3|nr:eukaryotic translation initiation factor 2-alpha kinase 3-like [Pollicipes pollicipes]